jgi:protein gp37
MDKRWGKVNWGKGNPRKRTSDANWRQPLLWEDEARQLGKRHRVFCASLADVFDEEVPDAWRISLIGLMQITPNLDWLLLTKRPQNIERMFYHSPFRIPDNIWIGTSVEDQKRYDDRIQWLFANSAKIRFLSVEPMLGPIDISDDVDGIDWVICGGESGPGARPMKLDWARDIRDQCARAGVPYFFKQLGGVRDKGESLESIPHDLRIREFPR